MKTDTKQRAELQSSSIADLVIDFEGLENFILRDIFDDLEAAEKMNATLTDALHDASEKINTLEWQLKNDEGFA